MQIHIDPQGNAAEIHTDEQTTVEELLLAIELAQTALRDGHFINIYAPGSETRRVRIR